MPQPVPRITGNLERLSDQSASIRCNDIALVIQKSPSQMRIDGKPATPERSTDRHHLFRLPTGASRIVADWSVQLDQLRTSK